MSAEMGAFGHHRMRGRIEKRCDTNEDVKVEFEEENKRNTEKNTEIN